MFIVVYHQVIVTAHAHTLTICVRILFCSSINKSIRGEWKTCEWNVKEIECECSTRVHGLISTQTDLITVTQTAENTYTYYDWWSMIISNVKVKNSMHNHLKFTIPYSVQNMKSWTSFFFSLRFEVCGFLLLVFVHVTWIMCVFFLCFDFVFT